MEIYTIGLKGKNPERFLNILQRARIQKVIDVRPINTFPSTGFADDMALVLSLVDIAYEHRPDLAPPEELRKSFKQQEITWGQYEEQFLNIMHIRQPQLDKTNKASNICLLCSEEGADLCHRRLLAEYFAGKYEKMAIRHL